MSRITLILKSVAFALCYLVANLSQGSSELFNIEPIDESLLQFQSSPLGDSGKWHLFVDNYNLEAALDLTGLPGQAALSSYTGRQYLLWQFGQKTQLAPTEASISFMVLPKISYNGRFSFGFTGTGYPRAWGYGPRLAVQHYRDQKASLAFAADSSDDWKTVEGSDMQLGVNYKAVLRLSGHPPQSWSVELYNGQGDLIASQQDIPYYGKWLDRFDCLLFQAAQDPVLIKDISVSRDGTILAQADFSDPSAYKQDIGLAQHEGWSTNSNEFDFSIVDTASITTKYLTAEPETLLYLSKDVYAAEDLMIEGVAILPVLPAQAKGYRLNMRMLGEDGTVLVSKGNIDIPSNKLAFYWEIPEEAQGQEVDLEIAFQGVNNNENYRTRARFEVAEPRQVSREGQVDIHVPGNKSLAGNIVPQTVGIPFPKGALDDDSRLRLLDPEGNEVEAAFQIDGRWSRYGSIRWLKCFFSFATPQDNTVLTLEYGKEGEKPINLLQGPKWGGSFEGTYVKLDAGNISARNKPTDDFSVVLKSSALSGAYLVKGDGDLYRGNTKGSLVVERSNAEQVVLRHRGWYEDDKGTKFCQFDNRITFFHTAPFLRVEHAWIFTGDGNSDTINEMGWRYDTAQPIGSSEFFLEEGDWVGGESLLQYEPRQAVLRNGQLEREIEQSTPGIMRSIFSEAAPSLMIGVRDFWQNYPGEIIGGGNSISVLIWPRQGRPHTEEVTVQNSYKLPFIHSGDELNFRLPQAYLEKPIYHGSEKHYAEGKAESANAQGIAKTTEMWLHFGSVKDEGALLEALMARELSAYIDPEWLAESGAFFEILAEDREQFPKDEATYEAVALAPARWAERMGVYGKWIWGDVLSTPDLANQRVRGNFRTFRKAHQGWPYSWLPYARSGDVRYRQFAEAATRHMADVAFCHYSDESAPRPLGFWNRSLIPWTFVYGTTSRHYADKVDYLWHAWHLADDYRAKETALEWEQATKTDRMQIHPWSGGRRSVNMLKSYVDAYQETADPWLIPAYRSVAGLHKAQNTIHDVPMEEWTLEKASFWNTGLREYLRYTGDEEYAHLYKNYADYWSDESNENVWTHYGYLPLEPLSQAWHMKQDPYYAKRIRFLLDWAYLTTYDGEEEWMQGFNPNGKQNAESAVLFAGYFLSQYPFAAKVLSETEVDTTIANSVYTQPSYEESQARGEHLVSYPQVYFRKASKPVPVRIRLLYVTKNEAGRPWFYDISALEADYNLEGEWIASQSENALSLEIPGETPVGDYQATISHVYLNPGNYGWAKGPALMLPLTSTETPEVFTWPRGKDLPPIAFSGQLWFRWPENEKTLKIIFSFAKIFNTVQTPKVLNAEGEILWQKSFVTMPETKGTSLVCELRREDFGPDGMVQVIFPGRDIAWQVEGSGQLYFSISKERWFQPKLSPSSTSASKG